MAGADQRTRARTVLNDHRLIPQLLQSISDMASDNIRAPAAGAERNVHGQAFVGESCVCAFAVAGGMTGATSAVTTARKDIDRRMFASSERPFSRPLIFPT